MSPSKRMLGDIGMRRMPAGWSDVPGRPGWRVRDERLWFTAYDTAHARRGLAQFLIMIRHPDDPDEPARGSVELHALRARWGVAPHLALRQLPIDTIRAALLIALDEHAPATFNRLGIAAFGLTANVTTSTRVLDMWWGLVEEGLVEHTARAPVLWRRTVEYMAPRR